MSERIQTALARARAKRAEQAERDARDTATALAPGQEHRVAATWSGLPSLNCTAEQLSRARIFSAAGGDAAIPFDMLRTRLLRELRAHRWRRVAITAPDPGCGTTTVAANLAFSLARQPELRTVLIEANLRHPSLARMLGISARPQFSRLLEGNDEAPAHLLRHGDNLCLGLNTEPVSNAAELLQNPGTPALLDRLDALLEPSVVLFDLPPMLRSDDALAFLDKVDCALLVVASDSTRIPDIETCAQDLARHTNALGVVLNKFRDTDETTGAGSA